MTEPEGLCFYTRDHSEPWLRKPFQLVGIEKLAIEVWQTTVMLSPAGIQNPTLDKLEFALSTYAIKVPTQSLIKRILILHTAYRKYFSQPDPPPTEEE